MNEYKKERELLNIYRNRNYNSSDKDERELAMAIDQVLPEFVKLVERATPMKPTKRNASSTPQCPSCGSQEVRQEQDGDWDRRNNYCPDCGQAIDWNNKGA